MNKLLVAIPLVAVITFMSACGGKPVIEHELACKAYQRLRPSTGIVKVENAPLYNFRIWSDNLLEVNSPIGRQYFSGDSSISFSLIQNKSVDENIKFQFSENYRSVKFFNNAFNLREDFECKVITINIGKSN